MVTRRKVYSRKVTKRLPTRKVARPGRAFTKFVMSIATSPDRMETLKLDPLGVMRKAGLTLKERALIISGNGKGIFAKLDPRYWSGKKAFFHVHIHIEGYPVRPTMNNAIRGFRSKK